MLFYYKSHNLINIDAILQMKMRITEIKHNFQGPSAKEQGK